MALSSTAAAGRFRSLVEGAHDPTLIADASGRWVAASPAVPRLLGFEREELLRRRVSDTLALATDGDDALATARLLAGGWQGELALRCKDGKLLGAVGWTIRLPDDDGDSCALFFRVAGDHASLPTRAEEELKAAKATAQDANRALRESEARFRGAFDGASIGMALVAVDGRFLQVNPALCAIVGYEEAELLARRVQEITHPDDVQSDREQLAQLLANEISTYQIEKFYVRKQGDVICGRLTVSLLRDPGGAPLYLVAQIQDITPFKAAGAALREAEARYRTLVEQTPAAVYVDAGGMLGHATYVSPRIVDLVGVTPEEWTSAPDFWLQFVHPEDRDRILAEIARANKSAGKAVLEYRFVRRDGRVVWVRDEATLVTDADGKLPYWQGILIDITERMQVEQELRAAKEAAEEASRLKSAFLSMATHELRTPLTIISGYVELLAESAKQHLTADEREYLDAAQAGARTLSALIDDLLDLARIEAGRLDLVIRPVQVEEVAERAQRMVAPQAAAKGLELEMSLADDLPAVNGDSNRLLQIFLNLLGNAVKFTEEGHVHCTVRRAGAGVEVVIADTGIGIPPEALPLIFEEFQQADSGTTRRFGGTGLGLAIARRLVDMHGGTISAESEVGVGSRFIVWLPADELVMDDAEQAIARAAP